MPRKRPWPERSSTQLGLLSRLTRETRRDRAGYREEFRFVYSDKNLTCADCGQEFVFTASEQDFYAQRGFTEPRRCPSCRASRKAARNAEGGGSSYGGYGAGGGYSAGGSRRLRRRWRWLRLPRPRSARDVRGHVLELRQGSPGPVPPDQRQARLLQRLLPEPARRLTQILSVRADPRPAEPASIPTRVVSRPGSFDSPSRTRLDLAPRVGASAARSAACRRAAPGRTCAPCRGAGGRCCRRGPAR